MDMELYLTKNDIENIADGIEISIPVKYNGAWINVIINKCKYGDCE